MAFRITPGQKKLALYGGGALAAYLLLWPHVADAITQAQGGIAAPPESPQPPAFVPVSPVGQNANLTGWPGAVLGISQGQIVPGGVLADGTFAALPHFGLGTDPNQIILTGPGGYGYAGTISKAPDTFSRLTTSLIHPLASNAVHPDLTDPSQIHSHGVGVA